MVHGKGKSAIHMAVAGMHAEVGGEALGDANCHRAIRRLNGRGPSELRSLAQVEVQSTVAGVKRKRVEKAVDAEVAVAGVGVDCAIRVGDLHMAITGLDAQAARDMIESQVPVASGQTQVALQPGESYISVRRFGLQCELGGAFDGHPGLLPVPADVHAHVRQLFEEKVNVIAALALLQAIVAQLPPLHFDVNPDFMAVPTGMKFHTGVRGFEGKRGLASDWIGLGPGVIGILREGGQGGENGEPGQCHSIFSLHGR